LHDEYIGCLVYADDIILLSASVVNLQRMLDVCHTVGANMDILFNAAKSTLFTVWNFVTILSIIYRLEMLEFIGANHSNI